jgi:hypothetical protein
MLQLHNQVSNLNSVCTDFDVSILNSIYNFYVTRRTKLTSLTYVSKNYFVVAIYVY